MSASQNNVSSKQKTFSNVACPFCGIHCDDLQIDRQGQQLTVKNSPCPRASTGFERKLPLEHSPQIDGKDVSLEQAITKAAAIINQAKSPLFAGLGTDVEGNRNILETADKSKGTVDHALSDGIMRNVLAMSERGWIMSTLTEVRNRADLVVFVGTDATAHPRFHQRILWPKEALFVDPNERQIVYLGKKLDTQPGISPKGRKPQQINCDIREMPAIVNSLLAILEGQSLQAKSCAGAKISDLKKLAEKITAADYPVFVWSASKLDFPNADLVIGAVNDLIRKLTVTQRAAGLSLGGDDGAASASAVCTWQAGYPLRTSFAQGYPDYNPSRYSCKEMLASGQADALIWVSTVSANQLPPESKLPTIVIAEPGMQLKKPPAVFIPAGTSGLDHVGKMVRVDSVISLPMQKLRDVGLTSVASIFEQIIKHIKQ